MLVVSLTACKSEESNPELRDPIYKDLVKEKDNHIKAAKKIREQIETLEKGLIEAEPNSIDVKILKKDLRSQKENLLMNTQKVKYYKIRVSKRRAIARRSYKIAFHSKKPWPDLEEYSFYKINKKLMNTHRDWSVRVPKLRFHPNYKEKKE